MQNPSYLIINKLRFSKQTKETIEAIIQEETEKTQLTDNEVGAKSDLPDNQQVTVVDIEIKKIKKSSHKLPCGCYSEV